MDIHSIIVVTSAEMINKFHAEIVHFFDQITVPQKDLILFSKQPILNYSDIKKISANEMIVLHQKDFFPYNLWIKPNAEQVLEKRKYNVLIHFNEDNSIRNTYLISKAIPSDVKMTNTDNYSKLFSVIVQHNNNYFSNVSELLKKLVL